MMTVTGVSRNEAESIALHYGMRLYKTSVKEDLNVDIIFQHLAENYIEKVRESQEVPE